MMTTPLHPTRNEEITISVSTPKKVRPPTLSLPVHASFSPPPRDASIPSIPVRLRKTAVLESSSSGITYGEASRRGKRKVHREDRSVMMPFISRSCELDYFDSTKCKSRRERARQISVFGVFDGHGGQRAAEFASARLPQIIIDTIAKSDKCVYEVLRDAFLQTDEEFLNGRRRGGKSFKTRQGSKGVSATRTSVVRATGESCHTALNAITRTKSGSRFMSVALQRGGSYHSIGTANVGNFVLSRSSSLHRYDFSSERSSLMSGSRSSPKGSPPSTNLGPTPVSSPPPSKISVPPTFTRSKSKAENQISELFATSNPTCGTTATVVFLIGYDMYIAYVGDSRAVVSICGNAVRMGEDHRPSREDEGLRIDKAGGIILHVGGTDRVNGVLAVSRAIGDQGLKEFVVAEPEIFQRKLVGDEDLFVVASDGLWDFVSDQESVDMARKIVTQVDGRTEKAAAELVNLACDRGSIDDISVVVVDMKEYRKVLQIKETNTSADTTTIDDISPVFSIKLDCGVDGTVRSDEPDFFGMKEHDNVISNHIEDCSPLKDSMRTPLDPAPTPRSKTRKNTAWQ